MTYYSTWCIVPRRGNGRWRQGMPLLRSVEVFIPYQGVCSLLAPLRNCKSGLVGADKDLRKVKLAVVWEVIWGVNH